MAHYQEITFSGSGASYAVPAAPGAAPFAVGSTPSGSRRANDRVSVIQRGGAVVEEIDRLSAAGEPSLTVWKEGPSRWIEQLQRRGACVYAVREAGAADFATIGQPFVQPAGSTFTALQSVGAVDIVRSAYADEGATAHETDTLIAATALWRSSAVVYRGGAFSGFATSMSAFSYSRAAPVIPPRPVGHCR